MVIDPHMYEKLSGRKGDPYERLGKALVQSDQREADRESEMHELRMAASMPRRWRIFFLNPKATIIAIVIVAAIALAARYLF